MITVLADDISGAAEIAGICLRYDLQIHFDFDLGLEHIPQTDVWIIASDTRSMSETKARERTWEIAYFLSCHCGLNPRSSRLDWMFKKIDSALRGHIIPEIDELLNQITKYQVFILPANPGNGRIIRDGVYYINGQPLAQTSFADDPDFPAKSSLVKEIIHLPDNEMIILPDIVDEKDYSDYAKQLTPDILPAGASAFFEACLQTVFPAVKKTARRETPEWGKNRLMICGSTHEASWDFIRKATDFDVFEIAVNEVNTLLENSETFENRLKEILHVFNRRKRLIVCTERKKADAVVSGKIKYLLAAISKYLLEKTPIEELFIEGGATAYACLEANDFLSLVPVYEYAQGVVRMEIPDRENLHLTIKPGSYSWPEKLI
ncbi:MAG: four-carbon acid sugar kinase family protein [Dysgonamonadaceae bacterium]|jgi:uncharacterized protein YgbK (DUF1537 family)|nr:four-carbon acid sugar kinase family protein [Dysgonamonadaceae bacterium]